MDGTNDGSCGTAVKRMGMLGVNEKMKAMTVTMETVTLIGKDRKNLTIFVCEINDGIFICYHMFHFWGSS